MAAKKKDAPGFQEIRNKKASHKYTLEEKFEAGIVLTGTEVKSVRDGKAQISEAFVRIEKNEAILYHAHIEEYSFGNINNHNPLRPRKLLLHKKQILKIKRELEAKGMSVVPTRLYLAHGLVKVEIALAKGKKLFDKREDLKKKTQLRDADRAMRSRNR